MTLGRENVQFMQTSFRQEQKGNIDLGPGLEQVSFTWDHCVTSSGLLYLSDPTEWQVKSMTRDKICKGTQGALDGAVSAAAGRKQAPTEGLDEEGRWPE